MLEVSQGTPLSFDPKEAIKLFHRQSGSVLALNPVEHIDHPRDERRVILVV
jgi:hypothetical protein